MTKAMLLLTLSLIPSFTKAAPSPATKSITLVGIEAKFHPEVLDLLQGIAEGRPQDPFPSKISACSNDEWLSENAKTLACHLSPNLLKRIQETRSNCRVVSDPLKLYSDLSAQPADFSDTNNIKTMLKIFASPLAKTKLPGALARSDYRILAESITLKVFTPEILNGISDRREALKSLKTNCSNETSIDQALLELESANHLLDTIQSKWPKADNLPFPSLTANERKMLTMFLSSMTWRARGGGLYKKRVGPLATQELRMKYIWNSYSTILSLLGAKSSLRKDMSFSLYVRGFKGWHDFWDMGTNATYTLEEDFRLMTARGLYQVSGALSALQRYEMSTQALELAGQQMGACYLFGWHGMPKPQPTWGTDLKAPFVGLSKGPTSWGELCFGAALGLGLAETWGY